MSQTSPTPNQRLVTELKVSAHLMLLDPGLFCVFHSPGAPMPDPATGLPGVRITRPPATPAEALSISTFNPDGWLGGEGNAALVRVASQPSQVLVTIYQAVNSAIEAPKLQVLRLSDVAPARAGNGAVAAPTQGPAPGAAEAAAQPDAAGVPASPKKMEVAAHVQRRGDLLTQLGEWMGERGSQSWIEGFGISPTRFVDPADIEYQAVLGKGWLSPWAEGGAYCGSRGMALPILGLRVRLRGDAAERYDVRVSATFTDGSSIGPVDGTETAEAASLAPLEAFMVEIVPLDGVELEDEDAEPSAPADPAAARHLQEAARPGTMQTGAQPAAEKPDRVKGADAKPVVSPAAKPGLKPAPGRGAPPGRPGPRIAPSGKSGKKGRR